MTTRWMRCGMMITMAMGCSTAPTETGGTHLNLGACPREVVPGMDCEASEDVACEVGDLLCWCAYDEASMGRRGRIECEERGGIDPGSCDEATFHARCEMGDLDATCANADGSTCSCIARDDGRAEVYCSDPRPPGHSGECTAETIGRCLGGEHLECNYGDGRVCACFPTPRGAEIFCTTPRPDPEACTDEHLARCFAGMPTECRYPDGRVCGCMASDSGGIELVCEGGVPGGDRCEDREAEMRCAAGEDFSCTYADGRRCWCEGDEAGMTGGLRCDPPPPPPMHPGEGCTDVDLERCRAGERVECRSEDGTYCWCDIEAGAAEPVIRCM